MVQEMKIKIREPLNKININKRAKAQTELGNLAIGSSIIGEISIDLTKCNEVLYATAKIMAELCSDSMKTKKKKKPHRRKKPMWKEKIEREIEYMRELSTLIELQRGINVKGRVCRISKRQKINKDNIIIIKETAKQKMQLKAQKLRRYEKRNKFYRQNVILKRDTKRFCRETITVDGAPSIEEVADFLEGYME